MIILPSIANLGLASDDALIPKIAEAERKKETKKGTKKQGKKGKEKGTTLPVYLES